jgi:hypothetical protein
MLSNGLTANAKNCNYRYRKVFLKKKTIPSLLLPTSGTLLAFTVVPAEPTSTSKGFAAGIKISL